MTYLYPCKPPNKPRFTRSYRTIDYIRSLIDLERDWNEKGKGVRGGEGCVVIHPPTTNSPKIPNSLNHNPNGVSNLQPSDQKILQHKNLKHDYHICSNCSKLEAIISDSNEWYCFECWKISTEKEKVKRGD